MHIPDERLRSLSMRTTFNNNRQIAAFDMQLQLLSLAKASFLRRVFTRQCPVLEEHSSVPPCNIHQNLIGETISLHGVL
jgi:hypothetical protein